MRHPKATVNWKGKIGVVTWIKTKRLDKFHPIRQVYGICLNAKNEILICKTSKNHKWQLPGGSPEPGETIKQTLKREFLEEIDGEIEDIKPLGVQKVEFPNEAYYQARCTCRPKKLLPQTPDPAAGEVLERKFVPISKATKYLKWGKVGEAIFKDALQQLKNPE